MTIPTLFLTLFGFICSIAGFYIFVKWLQWIFSDEKKLIEEKIS